MLVFMPAAFRGGKAVQHLPHALGTGKLGVGPGLRLAPGLGGQHRKQQQEQCLAQTCPTYLGQHSAAYLVTDAGLSVRVAEVQNAPLIPSNPNRLLYRTAQDAISRSRPTVVQLGDPPHVVTGLAKMRYAGASRYRA